MNTLIIGYGVSGKSAEALLTTQGRSVVVVDRAIEGVLKDRADFPLEDISQIVLSPGIAFTHPLVQRALSLGIEVVGEAELGLRNLQEQRCFGITGTNGKTTTVLLIEHILNASGKKAKALGNVGNGLCRYALERDPEDILIVELSSFQLESLKDKFFEAAIVLNITPNHLDRHASMEEYAKAKSLIANCVKSSDNLFVSDQVLQEFGAMFNGAKSFEVDLKIDVDYTKLGMASKQNIQAAYLLCKRCGVTDTAFLQGLKSFRKLPHRIEWVAEINGVTYYNDSKSSNVHSVMHAVEKLHEPLILIVGGLHKGASYKPWIEAFKGRVKQIIAYGQAAPLMQLELANHLSLKMVDRFADAVKLAKQEAQKSDAILLSPGCSSYDQFPSYEHRGDEFKRLVKEMI
jgi:UDP-N-acetylmuramoylalanine--D-glutamate ligase